ncbi:MAG: adenine phosphoribosyltransferase [Spirochaetia bacterium]
MDLDKAIRKVPNFPKPGILFYDITGILQTPQAFDYCIEQMAEIYKDEKIDAVAAVESRGFIFAGPFARQMNLPQILVRKKGKLPGECLSKTFQLEYGTDTIEVHVKDVPKNGRILIVDDLIATGGTLKASCDMFEQAGAEVAGVFGVVGLPFLNYEKVLEGYQVKTLINYDSE